MRNDTICEHSDRFLSHGDNNGGNGDHLNILVYVGSNWLNVAGVGLELQG